MQSDQSKQSQIVLVCDYMKFQFKSKLFMPGESVPG